MDDKFVPVRKLIRAVPGWSRLLGLAVLCCTLGHDLALAADPAFNPKPDSGDVLVPMPGNFKMVFVRVPVPGRGVLGGGERIFEIGGDRNATQPFEYPRSARIGGNFSTAAGDSYLVFGKYEVTIGQYAAVMGEGDVAKGVEQLRRISQIDQIPTTGVEQDMRFLSRPVHGISYDDHAQFISTFNVWCMKTAACTTAMRKEIGAVGAFRLPVEYEWEFVARGGSRASLPFETSIAGEYAFVNNPRRHAPDPIGQKKPLPHLPIYDIYGNVAELMGVPFTLDNGTGAVGGWVARGGDYKTALQGLRASMREEIRPFFKTQGEGGADVFQRTRPREAGIRLMIGAPIRDPDNKGIDDQIAREFQAYVSLGDGKSGSGDLAGNTRSDAKNLGTLDPRKPFAALADTVGGAGDPADWFTFIAPQYGALNIELTSVTGEVSLEYRHAAEENSKTITASGGRTVALPVERILPGQVYLRTFPARGGEVRYALKVGFEVKDRAGNTAREAADLGKIDGQNVELTDYVGPGDKFDVYKFTTGRVDTISARLLDLTADVNMELLGADEQVLKTSTNPRTLAELIDHANAAAGTYYLRVYSKDDQPGIYRVLLSLGVIDTAGNTRSAARDLGTITSDVVSIEEHLSETDKIDFFKLRVTGESSLTVQVARQTSDIDVFVYNDAGKEIGRSRKAGTQAEKIELGVSEGVYFIEVRNDAGRQTPYFMTAEIRPLAPYGHPDLAYKSPSIGLSPTVFSSAVNDQALSRFVEFTVTSGSIVRIGMEMVRPDPNTDVDLFLYNPKRELMARSTLEGDAAEEIVERLEPGSYLIRMTRDKGTTSEVRLSIVNMTQPVVPILPGRLVSTHDDWEVRSATVSGTKECYASTVAKDVRPSTWRARLPHLYFRINPGEATVGHSFDRGIHYNASSNMVATVETRSSGNFNIPLRPSSNEFDKADLRSLVPCTSGGGTLCVSPEGLRGLTRGHAVTLRGTSKDSRDVSIRYSLVGYQAAIRAMNAECGNASKTGWLIRE